MFKTGGIRFLIQVSQFQVQECKALQNRDGCDGCDGLGTAVVLVVQLVSHSCVADRLPVVVRFPAGPRVRLKTENPPKGNGLGPQKKNVIAWALQVQMLAPPLATLHRDFFCPSPLSFRQVDQHALACCILPIN